MINNRPWLGEMGVLPKSVVYGPFGSGIGHRTWIFVIQFPILHDRENDKLKTQTYF